MLDLVIPNMTCGHCVRTATVAARSAQAQAKDSIDLLRRRVRIDTRTPRKAVLAKLAEAGGEPARA